MPPKPNLSREERDKRRQDAIDKANKFKASNEAKEREEIRRLQQRIIIEMPETGKEWIPPIVSAAGSAVDGDKKLGMKLTSRLFAELPISQKTLKGLRSGGFTSLSEIQRGTIPHALAGRDVLGEAQTGSGKTLAFVVPCIEALFRESFAAGDGLGALIVTPTRELAVQIFDVLKVVGKFHDFSAGCMIGGTDVESERSRLDSMNILVCTPGRLQQHIDESPAWDPSALRMLILDEADRMLDKHFAATMDVILKSLPPQRQTLLFSATLHGAVQRLATMHLRQPVEHVAVDAQAKAATPARLQQVWSEVPAEQKVDTLFSFIRAHVRKRLLIFVSSTKQVRFLYEAFKILKPGCLVLELHGKQHQQRRLDTVEQFTNREEAVCLIATDVASRGLDFPSVDWVVQMDCPDSTATYLHRVGRTARFNKAGQAYLFLTPSEQPFLRKLAAARVTPAQMKINAAKQFKLKAKLASLLVENQEIRHLAQRAFVSYVRSVALMPDKETHQVMTIDAVALAESFGLAAPPAVNLPGQEAALQGGATTADVDYENNPLKEKKNNSKLEKLKAKIAAQKEARRAALAAAEAMGGDADEALEAVIAAEDESSSDEKKLSKKEKKLQRAKERRAELLAMSASQAALGEVDLETETDGLLVRVKNGEASQALDAEARGRWAEVTAQAARKQRIRLRKDGTARIPGTGGVQLNQHEVFDSEDEDGAEPISAFAAAFKKVQEEAAAAASSEEEDADVLSSDESELEGEMGGVDLGAYQKHLRKHQRRLAAREAEDEERERNRLREVKRRRKARLRANLGGGSDSDEGQVAVLASGSDDSENSHDSSSQSGSDNSDASMSDVEFGGDSSSDSSSEDAAPRGKGPAKGKSVPASAKAAASKAAAKPAPAAGAKRAKTEGVTDLEAQALAMLMQF